MIVRRRGKRGRRTFSDRIASLSKNSITRSFPEIKVAKVSESHTGPNVSSMI